MTVATKRPDRAIENLTHHQEQCDMDGVMVKVSRQALDEVLAHLRGNAQRCVRCDELERDKKIVEAQAGAYARELAHDLAAQAAPSPDILAVIDPFTRGAFTGWIGKTGDSQITLDEAEDHFSLCMLDMMDAVRDALSPLPSTTRGDAK